MSPRWKLVALSASLLSMAFASACSVDGAIDPEFGTVSQAATKPGGSPGDGNYCDDPANPCASQEGDCDSTAQCLSGLKCVRDIGAQFGWSAQTDVCLPPHCGNGQVDTADGELGVDCGGECGQCLTCSGSPGDGSYCSEGFCACDSGDGDCDSDAECQSGLVCVRNIGAQFGYTAETDVCLPDHCENGQVDTADGELGVDCGGECGQCLTCSGSPGDGSYCSEGFCACDSGDGDCDSDAECQSGLVCAKNIGAQFGYSDDTDVCLPAHCDNGVVDTADGETGPDCGGECGQCLTCPGQPGGGNYCTEGFCACDQGEGDCDNDDQCQTGLVCGRNNGARFGFTAETDVCWPELCENGTLDATTNGENTPDCGGNCGSCCGNGYVEGYEACDDGNHVSGDGCSGCQWEFASPTTAGQLVISEIMQNPAVVSDTYGEWIEIYNPSSTQPYTLMGMVLRDAGSDSHEITANLFIYPHRYIVLARNGDINLNGDVVADYVYTGFLLGNGADEVILETPEATVIDSVYYDGGSTFPDPSGASMSLDPNAMNASDNDTGSNWCEATSTFGDGDLGTPGAANDSCAAP